MFLRSSWAVPRSHPATLRLSSEFRVQSSELNRHQEPRRVIALHLHHGTGVEANRIRILRRVSLGDLNGHNGLSRVRERGHINEPGSATAATRRADGNRDGSPALQRRVELSRYAAGGIQAFACWTIGRTPGNLPRVADRMVQGALGLGVQTIVFPFISWDSLTTTPWSHRCAFPEDTRCPKWYCL